MALPVPGPRGRPGRGPPRRAVHFDNHPRGRPARLSRRPARRTWAASAPAEWL